MISATKSNGICSENLTVSDVYGNLTLCVFIWTDQCTYPKEQDRDVGIFGMLTDVGSNSHCGISIPTTVLTIMRQRGQFSEVTSDGKNANNLVTQRWQHKADTTGKMKSTAEMIIPQQNYSSIIKNEQVSESVQKFFVFPRGVNVVMDFNSLDSNSSIEEWRRSVDKTLKYYKDKIKSIKSTHKSRTRNSAIQWQREKRVLNNKIKSLQRKNQELLDSFNEFCDQTTNQCLPYLLSC